MTKTNEASSEARSQYRETVQGHPFGRDFFATVFADRVRAMCEGDPDRVPVVQLDLADGSTLDLCHIEALSSSWMAVMAYRDQATCETMDLLFVPYALVLKVRVSAEQTAERRVGFQLHRPSATA